MAVDLAPRTVWIDQETPEAYKAMNVLAGKVLTEALDSGLEVALLDLVSIRVSQINRCAYCLDLHTREALEHGETAARLAVLPAWRETSCFSGRERAALALAEAITSVATERLPDQMYVDAAQELMDDQVSAVAWLTIVMNAYNRIALTSRFPVPAGISS